MRLWCGNAKAIGLITEPCGLVGVNERLYICTVCISVAKHQFGYVMKTAVSSFPTFEPEKNLILRPALSPIMGVIGFFPFSQLLTLVISLHWFSRVSPWRLFRHFLVHLLLFIQGAGGKGRKKRKNVIISLCLICSLLYPCDEVCPWDLADSDWCSSVGLMASLYFSLWFLIVVA